MSDSPKFQGLDDFGLSQQTMDDAHDACLSARPVQTLEFTEKFDLGDLTKHVTPYGLYCYAERELASLYARFCELESERQLLDHRIRRILSTTAEKPELHEKLRRHRFFLTQKLEVMTHSINWFSGFKEDYYRQVDWEMDLLKLQRMEWEAVLICRFFKGCLADIKTQFDVSFIHEAMDLAMDMREYYLTDDQARQVVSHPNMEARKQAMAELCENEKLVPRETIYPLHPNDGIAHMIAQRRQIKKQKNARPQHQSPILAPRSPISPIETR